MAYNFGKNRIGYLGEVLPLRQKSLVYLSTPLALPSDTPILSNIFQGFALIGSYLSVRNGTRSNNIKNNWTHLLGRCKAISRNPREGSQGGSQDTGILPRKS